MKTNEQMLEEIYSHFPESEDKNETMNSLIVDCIETGIGYWCEEYPEAKGESEYYSERVWEAIKRGETLVFGDEDGETGDVNLQSVINAFNIMMKQYPRTYADIKEENWDAISCDVFFQIAAFGEVVYG